MGPFLDTNANIFSEHLWVFTNGKNSGVLKFYPHFGFSLSFPHIDTESKTLTKSLSATKPQPYLKRNEKDQCCSDPMLMLGHHNRQTKTEHFKAEAGGKVLVDAD